MSLSRCTYIYTYIYLYIYHEGTAPTPLQPINSCVIGPRPGIFASRDFDTCFI